MTDCERRIDAAKDRSRMVENRLTASIELYAQDRLFEARMGFAEVLRIDAGNPIATEYEGKCAAAIDNGVRRLLAHARDEAARGDHAAALASLDRGLAYRPDDKTLLSEIVVVREKRRTREAAAASESARPAPAPGAADRADLDEKYGAGLRYFEAGRFEDAARVLSHVWSVDPGYRDAADLLARSYLYMGMKVYSQGQYTEAIRIWERALAVDPDNVKAIRYLEKTRQEVDKLSGADHD
jgi:tetratricopeptide (TPR) repeat protein